MANENTAYFALAKAPNDREHLENQNRLTTQKKGGKICFRNQIYLGGVK